MPLTLYYIPDGPPSAACKMLLKLLNVDCKYILVDFAAGEHFTKEYAEKNPQKEIPVLEDDGFYLSESNAILQYLADKYGKKTNLYPEDLKTRAIINQRLCFNLCTYYASILDYAILPLIFDYEQNDIKLKRMKISLEVFDTYLKKQNTKYVAADHITIADLQLIVSTICLEAIDFDITPYKYVTKWYKTFKVENPEIWKIAEEALKMLTLFATNPPDFSKLTHPFHPIKPATA